MRTLVLTALVGVAVFLTFALLTYLALGPALTRRTLVHRLRNLPARLRGLKAELCTLAQIGVLAELQATVIRADGSLEHLGVVSRRVVTNNGVAFLADAMQGLTEPENINHHDCGTGTTAEAAADSALVTPFGGARVAGTQSEPAANQYRSTATISFSGSFAITEHGIFSAASAGTLFDRSVFAAVNVASGESIQFQYTLTFTAGG
ncbi:MAG TPA: hypothetical protein VEA99_08250 [Gemmatimonadaceae bacterium]|nr:hypothetical protein [Gemmatimonadaceae bacterium]